MTMLWSAQTSKLRRSGSAASEHEAWRLAIEQAVTLAAASATSTAIDAAEEVRLTVGEETAHLFPAVDIARRYDPVATREFAQQLIAVVANGSFV